VGNHVQTQVQILLAESRIKEALDTAKVEFKRSSSVQARADLVLAYFARIDQLIRRREPDAAKMTLNILSNRFPETRSACLERVKRIAEGPPSPLNDALRSVNESSPGSELEKAAMVKLSQEIVDPREVRDTSILLPDHPLKKEADIIWNAFKSVTEGNGIVSFHGSLRAISRNSPFAPWRRAIAAIDCFYRKDFAGMEHHVQGLSSDVPVGSVRFFLFHLAEGVASGVASGTGSKSVPRTVPQSVHRAAYGAATKTRSVVPAKIDETSAALLLARNIQGSGAELYADLSSFLNELEAGRIRNPISTAAELTKKLRRNFPGALPDFIRHIISWSVNRPSYVPVNFTRVASEAGIPEWKKLLWLAEASRRRFPVEAGQCLADAAFSPKTPPFSAAEKAWLLRTSADCLLQGGSESLECPVGPRESLLSVGELLRESLRLHYSTLTQEILLQSLAVLGMPFKEIETEALNWHMKEPHEIKPLLILLSGVRRRKSFLKAIKYVNMAEKIDPIHPLVRSARIEIKLNEIEESLNKRKFPRAEKAIQELQKRLPEGDKRRRFVEVLAWALDLALAQPLPAGQNPLDQRGVFGAGLPEAVRAMVFNDIVNRFFRNRFPHGKIDYKNITASFFPALARVAGGYLAAGKHLTLFGMPLMERMPVIPSIAWESEDLADLCETAFLDGHLPLLFHLSGIGLKSQGSEIHRYLFYRGSSWRPIDYGRSTELFRAAEALAQKVNDQDFLPKIQYLLPRNSDAGSTFFPFELSSILGRSNVPEAPLTPDRIAKLVEREKETDIRKVPDREYPTPLRRTRMAKKKPPLNQNQRKFEW